MGKPKKKDKKKDFASDSDDGAPRLTLADLEDDEGDDDIASISQQQAVLAKKQSKKQKKKVATQQSTAVNGANHDDDDSDDDDDGGVTEHRKKVSAKPTGFAALMMDDSEEEEDDSFLHRSKKGFASLTLDGSDEDDVMADRGASSDNDETPAKKPEKKGKEKKKVKKNKKKANTAFLDEDADLEKMLSELSVEPAAEPTVTTPTETAAKTDIKTDADITTTEVDANIAVEATSVGKTKAQIRKEKKERLKTEKASGRSSEKPKDEDGGDDDEQVQKDTKKGKKKAKEVVAEEDGTKKKGPGKKLVAALQEARKRQQEAEEKMRLEEEERIRREEEQARLREEEAVRQQELKELKKKQAKERRDQLKLEGKLLTPKQKQNMARAQAMLEARKLQGVQIGGAQKPRPSAKDARKQNKKPVVVTPTEETKTTEPPADVHQKSSDSQTTGDVQETVENEVADSWEDGVKDSWDQDSTDEEEKSKPAKESQTAVKAQPLANNSSSKDSAGESETQSSTDSSSSSSSDESSEEDERSHTQRTRERILARIEKRRLEARKRMSADCLRAPVICVLGHVDTGKTKILDKLRRTNVQEGEAGGITQQIGATNVPLKAIEDQQRVVKTHKVDQLKIPGLLIIDTPGHESFSNLRSRGSSLCDLAILVVDIMHGLEPQTIESINLLKQKRTPFVVALNKIDRLYDWETGRGRDVEDIVKAQERHTQMEFDQRWKHVMTQLAEQGLNARLFYENPNVREYLSVVPTSAITGEGMASLMALVVMLTQNLLTKRLMYSDELQATVLEVKQIAGLGTTIDVILINGTLREGSTVVLAGTEGPIVTQIRSLLMPQPLKELRVKNAYQEFREVRAAQGVKITAKDLEKSIAGLNLLVAESADEVDVCRALVNNELRTALRSIRLSERGVHVQASTLGSLEALLEFLRTSKIAYSGVRIGPIVKRDVMKASAQLQHDAEYACILAFDVKVERDAQELADQLSVTIFQADIIYHLFDKFTAYKEELKQRRREQHKHIAVFPCRMRVLPQYVFNSRDPIVVGVSVEAGIVRVGTPIAVPSRDFLHIGYVSSIENNHKQVESARQGADVCVKIEPVPGESPKMFGRHFDEKDLLTSMISRESIDACKNYFREDLIKSDWQLMIELKKLFQII